MNGRLRRRIDRLHAGDVPFAAPYDKWTFGATAPGDKFVQRVIGTGAALVCATVLWVAAVRAEEPSTTAEAPSNTAAGRAHSR